MQPINYYIQLADNLSTIIDNMNKKQLVSYAQYLLADLKDNNKFCFPLTKEYTLTFDQAVQLAHGCLAKATCM